MAVLENLLYTKNHEWIRVEGDKAYIGVTDHAQKLLGDIVFVDLPEEDDEFKKGESFSVIESVKAAADIYMPAGGKVIEVNEVLSDDPAAINSDAYENWMIVVELEDKEDLKDLLKASDYENLCKEEE
ncbi:glycine cleavage system protein GcvH [Clostridium frigidicarnis]|uniref:Glycine cleavage system H protein n=1 Tax=Clostridium frigidicarnis TaxID=84698 RepID=A0A1I0W812_9CLOT|nr:glycine cleavage system protein GcvH [Clostridium frigidicarnis]SFA84457.1 glycine cleavage system H protein [Clostridium frigidicarnis]